MGKFRDGMPVTGEAVTLILTTIDRIKEILGQLEATEAEPEGVDQDLIGQLEICRKAAARLRPRPKRQRWRKRLRGAEPSAAAMPAAATEDD